MVLLLCTLWKKDRGEGIDFALADFGGGWVFGVCKEAVSDFIALFCLLHRSSSSITNLLKLLTFSIRDS